MSYQLTSGDDIRYTDPAGVVWTVPADPRNALRAEYEAWLSAGGVPEPVPEPPLADVRVLAEASITTAAKDARARYATPGKEAVYQEKRDEGLRWIADGQPDDLTDYPWIRHEIGSTAPTAWELVQIWIGLNDFWVRTKAPQIEGIEMKGKARLLAAASSVEVAAVEAETLAELATA